MPVRPRVVASALVAFALLVVAWVLWDGEPGTSTFGWFAYEPLPDGISSNLVLMTGRRVVALAVGALGLVVLGFTGGLAVARRAGHGSA